MLTKRPPILDRMSALADVFRCRILTLLESHELTVTEICAVLQLPQSTVSRHLKTLVDHGWIVSRRNGTSRFYRLPLDDLSVSSRRLWSLTREQIAESPAIEQDHARLTVVLAERRSRSKQFFDTTAEDWDRLRDDLFGQRFLGLALLGLLERQLSVADLGCGTGSLAATIAPFVDRVIAVDGSRAMVRAATRRFDKTANVEVRGGDLEALPIDDSAVDIATLVLVLHHLPQPQKVLAEVQRIVRPGGRLLLVDMLPHDRAEYQQEMGHVWMGFAEEELGRLVGAAGMRLDRFVTLPPETTAKGPSLFAAIAQTD